MNVNGFDDIFLGQRLMAILRGFLPAEAVALASTAWDLGISAVEVPVQTEDALPSLRAVVAAGRERGRTVGAGTVISDAQLAAVDEAGAGFTVAPGLDLDIAAASAERGMPHLPGVATATELQRATAHGLAWVKVFPAAVLGASWFTLLRGPFPAVKFVATGGMSATNAAEFLDAGVQIVAVGSALRNGSQLSRLAELTGQSISAGAAS
jgi:2-dehydro-3-deoxyphosphogluconate aldolase/(4S)-4-hydroxy-2-oxoglutarate aldolase